MTEVLEEERVLLALGIAVVTDDVEDEIVDVEEVVVLVLCAVEAGVVVGVVVLTMRMS